MEKKRQHIIPKCYQKFWCDPTTPVNQTPYIWIFSKDGQQRKRKAPEKAFVGSEVYTVRLPDGKRDLVIEETLATIESKFVSIVKHKVEARYSLDSQDRANLCIFAAAMFCRVDSHATEYTTFLKEIQERAIATEKQYGAEPATSLPMAAMLENARPELIGMSLPMLTELYYGMFMSIFVAPATAHFITSDSPTVWFDPDAHRRPPYWRSPGLIQEKIEVTMPLTPKYTLFLSHNEKIIGYRPVPAKLVQELNRRTRFHCDRCFIPWKGEVCHEWFEAGTPPEDRWENTPEGKRARSNSMTRCEDRAGETGGERDSGETGVVNPKTETNEGTK